MASLASVASVEWMIFFSCIVTLKTHQADGRFAFA
jgi:hypothetical protein